MARFSWLWCFLLVACSVQSQAPLYLAPGLKVALMPPASYGGQLEAWQEVKIQRGQEEEIFLVKLLINPEKMELYLLGLLGQRIAGLQLDSQGLRQEIPPGITLPFDPAYVLLDVQLALWPKLQLPEGSSWKDQGDQRTIYRGQEVWIEIQGPRDLHQPLHIIHRGRGYQVWITSKKEKN